MCWTEFKHVHMVMMKVMARGSHLKAGHARSSCCSGREAATYRSEKEADIIIIMVASITPYAGTQYQWGHGLRSVFNRLFCLAIPLLKGPVLQASVCLAGNLLRGKTMKQALKNHVPPLVGDLMQAGGMQPARKCATQASQRASKRWVCTQGRTQKHSCYGDIFAW